MSRKDDLWENDPSLVPTNQRYLNQTRDADLARYSKFKKPPEPPKEEEPKPPATGS